jgi:CDP-glycerol glycerophosphotransferase (TagB/SpsB family)
MPEKSKILVFANSMNHISKLISKVKKLKENKNNEIIFVTLNTSIRSKLEEENINYRTLEDYKIYQELKDVEKKAMLWIKTWSNIKIQNDKNFKEITAYGNISLWWLTEVWFYLASFFNLYSIKETIKNIEIIQDIIDIEKPDNIIVANSKTLLGKITSLVGQRKNIPSIFIEAGIFFNFKYYFMKIIQTPLIKNFKNTKGFLREISGKILKFFVRTKNKQTKYKNKILFVTHPTYVQSSFNIETRKKIKEDIVIGPVIRELQKDKNNEILLVDTDPFPTFRFNFLFDKNYTHIESYLTKEIKKNVVQKTKEFSKKWEKLKREKSFINSLIYENIPIFELLEDKFSELFHRKFIESIKYIEMMKQVVKVENPNIILLVDEYHLYGIAAIIAGKLNNIPTLAIQHGAFTPYDLSSLHFHYEIPCDKFVTPNYCIIPDKTAVSGQYYKNILLNLAHFPRNGVIATGQPKYDVLAYADKIFKKGKIYDQFEIDYKKKIILLATQPFSKHENELLFRSVFREIKKLKDIQLVIKLHPNEYDESLHRNIAKEVGLDVILTKDINIFELLNACDVLMTVSSTVALEAMILDKPVIIVNLKNSSYETSFANSDATINVYKSEDIGKAIVKALNNKRIRKKLQFNMKKFVYSHAYKIDGLASKRIVKLISRMIK